MAGVAAALVVMAWPGPAPAQQFELSFELGFGTGLEAETEDGYGSTSRLPAFTRLNMGYQWEGDTRVELGLTAAVPIEHRAGLLLVPRVRLNQVLMQDLWLYGSLGAAADVLPDARFGFETEIGTRYDVLESLGVYLSLGLDLFVAGPGVGRHGMDLVLSACLGLRTSF